MKLSCILISISSIIFLLFGVLISYTLDNAMTEFIEPPNISNLYEAESSSLYRALEILHTKTFVIEREKTSAFIENGGIIDSRYSSVRLLCLLGVSKNCHSEYISDVMDLYISFNPVYSVYQKDQHYRYSTHFNFLAYLKTIGIKYQVTEAILPNRGQSFVATNPGNEPWEVQLTIENPIYYRENLVNVAVRKIKDPWEYLLLIDGHQYFHNTYWFEETIWKLEHYTGVQFFQFGKHLNLANETIDFYSQPSASYMHSIRNNLLNVFRYSGNAWAMRRETYEQVGFIIDYCIIAGCDGSYLLSTLKPEEVIRELNENAIVNNKNYFKEFDEWIWNATKAFKGQNTFVRGNMTHFYHEEYFSYAELVGYMHKHELFSWRRDYYRDENFTLHLRNDTIAALVDDYFFGHEARLTLPNVITLVTDLIFNVFFGSIRYIAENFLLYKV